MQFAVQTDIIRNDIMILSYLLMLMCAVALSQGQEAFSLTVPQELNDYCDARCNRQTGHISSSTARGPVGKARPRGPKGEPGPQGIVNYTAVEEMIIRIVDEALQQRLSETRVDATPSSTATALSTTTDGWTVFQRRQDGSVDFFRSWDEYVNGFGNEDGEFWIGLEKLHLITSSGSYELRIDLEDWERNTVYAQYSEFSVGSASTRYRLTVAGYSGTAGNALMNPTHSDNIHNGMAFSTKDSDNDGNSLGSCAKRARGGWWYNSCYSANLNGIYHRGGKYSGSYVEGIGWFEWKRDWWYSLKFVEMKLRPSQ